MQNFSQIGEVPWPTLTQILQNMPLNLQGQIVLCLNGQITSINKAVSKPVYKELRNRVITIPSAQDKDRSSFINDTLDWPEIYSLLHRVTSDTKMQQMPFFIKWVLSLLQCILSVERRANPSNISLSIPIIPKNFGQTL